MFTILSNCSPCQSIIREMKRVSHKVLHRLAFHYIYYILKFGTRNCVSSHLSKDKCMHTHFYIFLANAKTISYYVYAPLLFGKTISIWQNSTQRVTDKMSNVLGRLKTDGQTDQNVSAKEAAAQQTCNRSRCRSQPQLSRAAASAETKSLRTVFICCCRSVDRFIPAFGKKAKCPFVQN